MIKRARVYRATGQASIGRLCSRAFAFASASFIRAATSGSMSRLPCYTCPETSVPAMWFMSTRQIEIARDPSSDEMRSVLAAVCPLAAGAAVTSSARPYSGDGTRLRAVARNCPCSVLGNWTSENPASSRPWRIPPWSGKTRFAAG